MYTCLCTFWFGLYSRRVSIPSRIPDALVTWLEVMSGIVNTDLEIGPGLTISAKKVLN